MQRSQIIINYAFAIVSGKEEIEFNGKKYEAFVIDSESWGKGISKTDYESSSATIVNDLKKKDEKWAEKLDKKNFRSGLTNEDGYLVTSSREWYIPGIGIVKFATYDMFGNFQSITTVTAIE